MKTVQLTERQCSWHVCRHKHRAAVRCVDKKTGQLTDRHASTVKTVTDLWPCDSLSLDFVFSGDTKKTSAAIWNFFLYFLEIVEWSMDKQPQLPITKSRFVSSGFTQLLENLSTSGDPGETGELRGTAILVWRRRRTWRRSWHWQRHPSQPQSCWTNFWRRVKQNKVKCSSKVGATQLYSWSKWTRMYDQHSVTRKFICMLIMTSIVSTVSTAGFELLSTDHHATLQTNSTTTYGPLRWDDSTTA